MHLLTLPVAEAVGYILRHHVLAPDGRKQLSKGRTLTAADSTLLTELGVRTVRVAVLEADDIHEDEAARRIADALGGPGITRTRATAGRVNLLADHAGVLRIDVAALEHVNDLDGVAIATLPTNQLVAARERVATVKIIPFSLPASGVAAAEDRTRPTIQVDALAPRTVGLLLVGDDAGRARLDHGLAQAVTERVTKLGASIAAQRPVAFEEHAVAAGLLDVRAADVHLIIIAGETSIMDAEDVVPCGVRLAGGRVEHYGAPVEPGNLLLLAYLSDGTPVLGAPGCVRSRDRNIVDLVLPRLLVGEHLTRRDIVQLGHGGLL